MLITALVMAPALRAQMPAVRQIGRLEHMTTDSLASATGAIPLPDGRVLVNDARGRRLLVFDSTLSHPIVIADTTDATLEAYSRQVGSLIHFRGDSALFVDVGSLSMIVVRPDGRLGRILAVPHPDDAQHLFPVFGLPGFDVHGRLVYHTAAGPEGIVVRCCIGTLRATDASGRAMTGKQKIPKPDSAFLVAVDLSARRTDTIAAIKIAYTPQRFVFDNDGYNTAIEQTYRPLPVVDAWAVLSDGTVAIVRGRDFHVDFLAAGGRWTSAPKLPFDWQRLDDARKMAIIDSATKEDQTRRDSLARRRATQSGPGRGGGGRGGGGRSGGVGSGMGGQEVPGIIVRAEIQDVPDYVPPFGANAAFADMNDNLWIRTSTLVGGRPVYDVVNRRGELIDRVQLPSFRTIAGFGRDVIYMAVQDPTGAVHLERARIH